MAAHNLAVLRARHAHLVEDVRLHKSAVQRHRRELWAAKTALDTFEADLRRLGIRLTFTTGEGSSSHGQSDDRTAP